MFYKEADDLETKRTRGGLFLRPRLCSIAAYFKGVTEPVKRTLSECNIKVASKTYLTLGHVFPKLRNPTHKSAKRTEDVRFIFYTMKEL